MPATTDNEGIREPIDSEPRRSYVYSFRFATKNVNSSAPRVPSSANLCVHWGGLRTRTGGNACAELEENPLPQPRRRCPFLFGAGGQNCSKVQTAKLKWGPAHLNVDIWISFTVFADATNPL